MPTNEADRNCAHCSALFTYSTGYRGRPPKFCSEECCETANRQRQGPARPCGHCGLPFTTKRGIYCSRACRGLSQRKPEQAAESMRSGASRRRALKKGVTVEKFTHLEVYERDRWKCGLCGKRVDRSLRYPDPMSASLDHIVPLCDGGEHSLRNSQCSHWICNSRKTFGAGGQMRLFG